MALLEIKNMTHCFGGLRAVHDFKLTLEGGELMGLIGPNGAGKTTVFNLVSGFYKPTEGKICFEKKEIAGLRPHQVTALGMARTFQNIRLWNSLSVFDNLCISQHHRLGYGLVQSVLRGAGYRGKTRIGSGRRPRNTWRSWAWSTMPSSSRKTSPTGSRGASKSGGPWRSGRGSCSSMNRPRG